MNPHRWLVAATIFVVIEILPPVKHFAALCLALGALAGAIAAAFTPIVWIPWAVFIVSSAALFPLLIPMAKFLFKREDSPTSNNE